MLADDLYERLGVMPSATTDEIAAAFRARAKELHPDLHPGDGRVAEAFKELTQASTVLTDPDARAAYDSTRVPAPSASPTPAGRAGSGHPPVFRTTRSARTALWAGVGLVVFGLACSVALAAVPTGDPAKTITLWLVAAKLLICGAILWGAGIWRLHRLTGLGAVRAPKPTER
jgi:hypothetical protein